MAPRAVARPKPDQDPPAPAAIVRFYPNPVDIIREYIESDFARELALEHERKVRVLTDEGCAVTDPESYARVGERLVEVATHRKDVEAWFKPLKDFAYRLHRMICDREAEVLDPLVRFQTDGKANRFRLEQEDARKRREEEQRLADEARRAEQERLQREAELMEQRGEHAVAGQILEQAVHTPAPVFAIPSALPKTRGVSSRENWKWRPAGGDSAEARARAERLVPREFLELSDRKLTAHAKAHRASARVPGIEFYDAGSVTVRG